MKADLEQASWCLLVNVTGERYYGSFEVMSLNERKYYRERTYLQRAGYFGKTAQQGEKMFVYPIHRGTLGKDWGNPTGRTECRYPDHKGKQTCAGEKLQSVGVRR